MYPHEFSGGMRQRVMIAMALITKPDLLIADEPTTALDVTVQAQILELMKKMRNELGMAVILISHDLGVVSGFCDRAMVMYAGRVMESAKTDELFYETKHPYTQALQKSIPALHAKGAELYTIPGAPPDLLRPFPGCPSPPLRLRRGLLRAGGNRRRWKWRPAIAPPACACKRRIFHYDAGRRTIPARSKISRPISLSRKGFLFKRHVGSVRAVDGVSLDLRKGKSSDWSANPAAANPPWDARSCN